MNFNSVGNKTNYYEVLGVSRTASEREIKSAYNRMALKYHPDKAHNLTKEKAEAAFQKISEAYTNLSDPEKRKIYDMNNDDNRFVHVWDDLRNWCRSQDFLRKSKEEKMECCFPRQLDKEIIKIIDADDFDLLEKHLKDKNYDKSLLNTILYKACKTGKLNIVKFLIDVLKLNPHLNIDENIAFSGPIFKAAAISGNLNLVKYLLEEHRADIESQGLSRGTRFTALSSAAEKGHLDVVNYLISKGANLNPEISYSNILNRTTSSNKLAIVMALVNAGTKIDDYDLWKALEIGNIEIVQFFLQKKPGIRTHQYLESPACHTIKSGNVALLKYLEEKENLNIFEQERSRDNVNELLIKAGAISGSIEMMRYLLEEKGLDDYVSTDIKHIETILGFAMQNKIFMPKNNERLDRVLFVRFLIEEKGFILPNEKLSRLIGEEAQFSGIEMNSYLQSYLTDTVIVKNLLHSIAAQGLEVLSLAELFTLHNSGWIKKGKYEDFRLDIHIHIQDRKLSLEQQFIEILDGNMSHLTEALFYYSSYYFKNDVNPLKLLVALGADVNAENSEGETPIHIAFRSGGINNIVKFYIEHNADLSKKNKHGETAAEILENRKFNSNW